MGLSDQRRVELDVLHAANSWMRERETRSAEEHVYGWKGEERLEDAAAAYAAAELRLFCVCYAYNEWLNDHIDAAPWYEKEAAGT
jgi:hypothetical protein